MFIRLKRTLKANKKINTIFLFAVSFLIAFASLGYSAIQQNLMIAGDVDYINVKCEMDDSWETIVNNIKKGKTNLYPVGCTKEVDLGTLGIHMLRVANNSTPSECSGSNYSQTACGFVLEFADVITTHSMNSGETNVGGWPASAMRTYLNDTNESTSIINSLPTVIKNAIIDTKVVSGHGSTTGETNFTSTDKIYLLSTKEVFGKDGATNLVNYDSAESETRQLDYYKGLNVTTSNYSGVIKKNNNSNEYWWLRSADSHSDTEFYEILTNGNWTTTFSFSPDGVSPAFRIGSSFATDSWEVIVENVASDNIDQYNVGDTKTVDLGSLGTHTIRIANKSTPSACSGSSYSQTACGFVLEFADLIGTRAMHSSGTNVGSWPKTTMRTYVNSTVYNALPEALRGAIIDTKVISGHGSTSGESNFTSTDKLYLLSMVEVYGANYTYDSLQTTQTRQLDYYSQIGVTTSSYSGAIKKNGTTNTAWRLRSPRSNNTTYYDYISNAGARTNGSATTAYGVSPAFRLGKAKFLTDSWETIIENVISGDTSMYHIGDTKPIDMGEFGTHTLRITNNSTPEACSGQNYSQTACGFVLEFVDVVTNHRMSATQTNVGGWPATELKGYLASDIYPAIPEVIRNAIVDTRVISGYGNHSGESNYVTTEKLYLLSSLEVYATPAHETLTTSDTRQLDYYANLGVTTSNRAGSIKYDNGTAARWWLRNPYKTGALPFNVVNASGNVNYYGADQAAGVSPAFRIGIANRLMQHDDDDTKTFGKSITRDSFESITTVNHINVPATAIDSWDVSAAQNGSVLAWYLDADSDSKYELYLGQSGGVVANTNSNNTFEFFRNIDSLNLSHFHTYGVISMNLMFHRTGEDSTIFTLDLGNNFDTSNVTGMNGMFASTGYSSTVFTLDLGDKLDTSNVTDMGAMFACTGYSSTVFTLDLGDKFDTSNVTSMSATFNGITNGMFDQTGYSSPVFTLDLGDKFDTSNVTNMARMFAGTGYSSTVFTLDLGDKFDTSNVTSMSASSNGYSYGMFHQTGYSSPVFTLDLGDKFDTSNVTDMSFMFAGTGYSSTVFTLDLGDKFDTSNVTDMSGMFFRTGFTTTVFTLDLGDKFDTSNVTLMSSTYDGFPYGMFDGTGYSSTVFTLDLGDKFDTSNVTNMQFMFFYTGYSSTAFTLDLGDKFDTSNVTNMAGMFAGTGYSSPVFTLDLGDSFDTSNVTSMSTTVDGPYGMFYTTGFSSTVFTLDLGDKFDTSNVTDMYYMFAFTGRSSTVFTLDLGDKFDTSNVTDMTGMFYCTGFSSTTFTLNLGNKFVTSNVTSMSATVNGTTYGMFGYTGYANTRLILDLSTCTFTNVTSYNKMFEGIRTTGKVYVKDATARSWVIARDNNLTTSNVIIKT